MNKRDMDVLDKISDKLDDVTECQIRMEADLKYHIKRTDLLENKVKPIGRMYDSMKLIIPFLAAVYTFRKQLLDLLQ
jgi:hypothetical protein